MGQTPADPRSRGRPTMRMHAHAEGITESMPTDAQMIITDTGPAALHDNDNNSNTAAIAGACS